MNAFEVAVLRILIKRQHPLKLSDLISGFPDECEDNVLTAVSSLRLQNYVIVSDYQQNNSYVSINKERRKEILRIVDNTNTVDIGREEEVFKAPSLAEDSDMANKRDLPIEARQANSRPTDVAHSSHRFSPRLKATIIGSLLAVGIIGFTLPIMANPNSDTVDYQDNNNYYLSQGHSHYYYSGDNDNGGSNNNSNNPLLSWLNPDKHSPSSLTHTQSCNDASHFTNT